MDNNYDICICRELAIGIIFFLLIVAIIYIVYQIFNTNEHFTLDKNPRLYKYYPFGKYLWGKKYHPRYYPYANNPLKNDAALYLYTYT